MSQKIGEIIKSLRELAGGDDGRSETARLKEVYEEVEKALSAGVKQAAIHEALVKNGFSFSLSGFKSSLARIRKNRTQPKPSQASAQTLGNQEPAAPKKLTNSENVFSSLNNKIPSDEDPRRVTALHKVDRKLIYGNDDEY